MKNLIHSMRDMNVTNSLKASIVDKNFTCINNDGETINVRGIP